MLALYARENKLAAELAVLLNPLILLFSFRCTIEFANSHRALHETSRTVVHADFGTVHLHYATNSVIMPCT